MLWRGLLLVEKRFRRWLGLRCDTATAGAGGVVLDLVVVVVAVFVRVYVRSTTYGRGETTTSCARDASASPSCVSYVLYCGICFNLHLNLTASARPLAHN